MSEQTHLNKLSLIIPVFNEEVFLKENISSFTSLQNIEIIFVDGGSGDSTRQILENHGLKVILSPVASRSYQMNLGARLATGNILLFLHGDSLLPNNYFEDINFILSQNRVIAGAFNLKINHDSLSLYLISVLVKLRSHLFSLPYGDQGFFLKKETFETVGGFPEIAIMEDFAFIKKLQKMGKIKIAHSSVTTSARRWQKLGIFKTTMINQIMILGYYLKINPDKLAQFYRDWKKS
ncbi:TIGR04283 family arsenosugar biosynthesis glycosyltransferase [Cyanobacterium sp. IPPAS B-1200]|uniref:TIGR04283 family arsenosugar biosynthesis glycosyltransferase n=1 Tax=Cyanobacterium sp. IPPAS B-1200 TaxID=1562720 RepID=UPI0008526C56|nr:TIGR04283 family arsenosugar biosynthesis glycosyltransferase [Cyanobacterium sp. IPPAS B-1200]OEJ80082.1 glycosyltransferase [Cyanobacterium sp. IPPAS B-1200]